MAADRPTTERAPDDDSAAARMAAGDPFPTRADALRHPVVAASARLRAMAARDPLRGLVAAWTRLRLTTVAFRVLSPTGPDGRALPDAQTDWLGPLALAGRSAHALRARDGEPVTYAVTVRPGSRVRTWCAVAGGRAQGAATARFTVAVEIPSLGWRGAQTLALRPDLRLADQGWRNLTVILPPLAQQTTALVHLAAAIDGGPRAGGDGPAALWGDPRIEARRPVRDSWHSVVSLAWRLRYAGVSGTTRYLRDVDTSDSGESDRYRLWLDTHTPGADDLAELAAAVDGLRRHPRISVLTPVFNTDARWLRACIDSVRRQVYPHWELCLADDGSTSRETLDVLQTCADDARIRLIRLGGNAGVSAATNAALAAATGDYVALLDHDDELAPDALAEVARHLDAHPATDAVYTDEDKLDSAGVRCEPFFKPDWSPDYLRSTMYACHLLVMRTALIREIGGFRSRCDGAQDHDVLLRLSERTAHVAHLPKVLYHWRKAGGSTASSGFAKSWALDAGVRALEDHAARMGLDATVEHGVAPGLYRVRYRIAGAPLVSVIIPTAGQTRSVDGAAIPLIERCLTSIMNRSTYGPVEVVIVDNGLPPEVEAFLRGVPHVRARCAADRPFNFSDRINHGARAANGRHLILLNDDVEVLSEDWIEALLEHSQQAGVGVVGAKLFYPDGRLQHAGILTGVCGIAAHAFYRHPGSTVGYGFSAAVVRNYSAVTAACLMTRRDVWEQLGGFDDRYALDFNDLDYCLRARGAGFRVVFTPYATLTHLESASSGARSWSGADVEAFRLRWAGAYEDDPYYSPHLSRDSADFRIRVS